MSNATNGSDEPKKIVDATAADGKPSVVDTRSKLSPEELEHKISSEQQAAAAKHYPAGVVLALVFSALFLVLMILEACAGTQQKYLFWMAIVPFILCVWGFTDAYKPSNKEHRGMAGSWIAAVMFVAAFIIGMF